MNRRRMWMKLSVTLAVLTMLSVPLPSLGDDVEDSIKEAEKLYKSEDYNESIKELEFAIQLIRQKKSERLKDVFPSPLEGWGTKDPQITTAGSAFLGGGIQASREYTKGSSRVVIEMVMDNPILQGILTVLESPMVAEAGSELARIKGQRAIVKFDPSAKDGELNLVFKRKVLVTVRGYGIESTDSLKQYAERIQFDDLEKLIIK